MYFFKCGGSYITIEDQYAKICAPSKVKNMNIKVFNLISGVNETRFLVQHELCECKCRLNESPGNSKQKRNHDEYQCQSKN